MTINDIAGLIGYSGLALGMIFIYLCLVTNVIFLIRKDKTFGLISRTIVSVQFICLMFAIISLVFLLLNNAFEYPLVFNSVEKSMPWVQKLSGLWSGQSSSLLFWSFILSLAIVLVSRISCKYFDDVFSAVATLMLIITLVFFLTPVQILANPFDKLWQLTNGITFSAVFAPVGARLIVPMDGAGMNPSLRHIAMLLHPPFLYLGLVGYLVPYALVLAAMIRDDLSDKLVNLLRSITLFSWIFLTLGMILGSWWAYTILGWGGYWGWDAVEIAGLLPWLLSFGFIHSLQMQSTGKNYLRWIVVFAGMIFFSILSGILITRSGILESVHAYSAGVMGPVLSIFISINLFVYVFLVHRNWMKFGKVNEKKQITIFNLIPHFFNYFLLALVLLFFIGQTFPLSSQLFSGVSITWKAENYEALSSPLLFLLLFITAICPIAPFLGKGKLFWNKTRILLVFSSALLIYLAFRYEIQVLKLPGFWIAIFVIATWMDHLVSNVATVLSKKNNSKKIKSFHNFGISFIHIGLGLMALGIVSQESISVSRELKLEKNEQACVNGFQIKFLGAKEIISSGGTSLQFADFSVTDRNRNNFLLSPDLEFYPKLDILYARPALVSNIAYDFQIILNKWMDGSDPEADIHINFTPLMVWTWIGGFLMSSGGFLVLFVRKR